MIPVLLYVILLFSTNKKPLGLIIQSSYAYSGYPPTLTVHVTNHVSYNTVHTCNSFTNIIFILHLVQVVPFINVLSLHAILLIKPNTL